MSENNNYVLLTGTANVKLAENIAELLGKTVHQTVSRFADGETGVMIPENLRSRKVFIIQPTCPPVNDNLVELLFMIDAAKRASAAEINVVIPYFGYSRQDRKDRPRVPISASLVAQLIEYAGADRIITVDIHSDQEQGFIKNPWDNLYGSYSFIPVLKNKFPNNLVVASPDKGGVLKATFYADRLNADGIAIVFKERDVNKKNESKSLDMIGEVSGKDILIVDDMIDTAGTIVGAADLIKDRGAKSITVAATHGLFSGPALERINKSAIEHIFVTDTCPIEDMVSSNSKYQIVSVAPLLAEAIRCVESGDSLSTKLIP